MDAHLDTFNDELCQVNTRVVRIAQCRAAMGGYTPTSPSPPTSKDEDDDGDINADEDDDARSSSDDEMST